MEVLRDLGYQAVEARDGHAALALIEQDPTIELVLSDVVMPGGMAASSWPRDCASSVQDYRCTSDGLHPVSNARNGRDFTFIAKPYAARRSSRPRTAFEREKGGVVAAAPKEKTVKS